MPSPVRRIEHLFTVDVEEYFQVHAFERIVTRDAWDRFPSRVLYGVEALLELLARYDATATFFVLGWVARRHPGLVRRVAAAGHEIASHGWWHRRVTAMTQDEFRADVRDSKALLEDLTGEECAGYRAPSFSITPRTEWALDVLVEEEYHYDSSLFPIRRADYGHAEAPPLPHYMVRPSGVLVEFPPTTLRYGGTRVPAAGGGWFRQLPYALTRRAFAEHDQSGIPGVFYIHPWELDPAQPRLAVGPLTRIRHYRGLAGVGQRLERLLEEFRFRSIARQLADEDAVLEPAKQALSS
jgi:polysaccharide deacetylase family protein (PEP-CTERM system associated)